MKRIKFCVTALICLELMSGFAAYAAKITSEEFKSKVEQATKGFKDISLVGNVTYKNRDALAKVDASYSRLYEFKTANVFYKAPDKLRMEGKLGMVKFEYIINGGTKCFRAPAIKMNKKEDYSKDPAKLQDAFDFGLITPAMWKSRSIEIMDDPEADANNEIKIKLSWPKGNMAYYAWVDVQNLWLKKFEKRDSKNNLEVRIVYSDPIKAGDAIWMPQKVEMYAPDGIKAGSSEFTNIKVNTDLQDKLFQ